MKPLKLSEKQLLHWYFWDVNMPVENGFKLFEKISYINFYTVFLITNSSSDDANGKNLYKREPFPNLNSVFYNRILKNFTNNIKIKHALFSNGK